MSAKNPTEATGLHPTARPAEKRRDIRFSAKDVGLREDVHNLASMIGEMLREQGGAALLDIVERGRRAAIDRREGDPDGGRRLQALFDDLNVADSRDFIRAFSTYFQVVNTAEQAHRLRRRRDYLRDLSTPQPGGIEDAFCRLRDHGMGLDDVLELMASLRIEPVFTAHPTEPTRRTVLRKQQHIVRRLIESQNPSLIPQERAACFNSIRDSITAIWQTDEHPGEDRTAFDDMEHVLFFMTDVIYRAIPVLYESMSDALVAAFGDEARGIRLPNIVQFASWIGGDMHARPDTTARTIRQTLDRQRTLILNMYHRECRQLIDKLSQSKSRVTIDPGVFDRIDEYSSHFPEGASSVPARHREMPYRVFLHLILQRLQATFDDDAFRYESADELLADLRLISKSLAENRGRHAGLFAIERMIRRVESFGFHFMTLDIRQNALVNRGVVGRCLGEEDWLEQPAEYRAQRIHEAIERNTSPVGAMDNVTKRDLAVFQAIAYCRRKFGERAIGPYVVSMAHGLDDVLSVILLARWGDLQAAEGAVPLDIAPYFETVEDLANCSDIMRSLLQDPIYRDHVERRNDSQIVMVSYSDSNKDAGLAPARWTMQQAQAELLRCLRDIGVELTIFHGRGGTISRGGGKTHHAVQGAPAGTINGHLRVTEGGEQVNARYGLRGVALRTLEQAVSAVAVATVIPERRSPEQLQICQGIMDAIAGASRERYQTLIRDGEDFFAYFRAATPVDVIERMGQSEFRQASGHENILNLSGVPWDFAWTQSRHILPGWYGVGTGLARAIDEFGMDTIREMSQLWPFLRGLLADLETVLAKADLNIANHYSELAGTLHHRFFPLLRMEFDLCVEQLLTVKEQEVLLEKQPSLRRAIRLRNPYVDTMSLLQVDLLRRWRAAGRPADDMLAVLLASVDGIARGLQDYG